MKQIEYNIFIYALNYLGHLITIGQISLDQFEVFLEKDSDYPGSVYFDSDVIITKDHLDAIECFRQQLASRITNSDLTREKSLELINKFTVRIAKGNITTAAIVELCNISETVLLEGAYKKFGL